MNALGAEDDIEEGRARRRRDGAHPHRVVVVGAGFGGLALARALRASPVEVTVVDRVNYHTFQPLLYEVATAGLGADDVAHSVRGIIRDHGNAHFRLGTVAGVDLAARALVLEDAPALRYDTLVLAAGAVTATYGVPGVAEHAFFLKSLPDALRLRNHVLDCFERADADPRRLEDGTLTFVVAGGGATGVELAGAFVELISMVLARDFPALDVGRARVVLVEAAPHLLGAFRPRLQARTVATLRRRGVDVRLECAIDEVTPGGVRLAGGEFLPSETVVWAAGVRASPLADTLGLDQDRVGRLEVAPDLSLPAHPEVFAVGDMAAAAGPDGRPYPQLAPVAIQGARHVAAQLGRRLAGDNAAGPAPFRYRDRGTMATIGRHAAVAQLPGGIAFGGFPAWTAWLGLHLVQLIGFRNRLNVLTNWAWRYATWDRGARLILEAARREVGPPRP